MKTSRPFTSHVWLRRRAAWKTFTSHERKTCLTNTLITGVYIFFLVGAMLTIVYTMLVNSINKGVIIIGLFISASSIVAIVCLAYREIKSIVDELDFTCQNNPELVDEQVAVQQAKTLRTRLNKNIPHLSGMNVPKRGRL